MPVKHEIDEGQEYVIGDAVEILEEYEDEAAAVFLDDAWARPNRKQQFGVDYDTHPFDEAQKDDVDDFVDTSITTTEVVDACHDALIDGGWFLADTDDWLLPRLINYIREDWGDVANTYRGGGYRKVGGVTYLTKDGIPDRSTAGMYFSTGGYSVVFAHKGETDRQPSTCARQLADRPQEYYDWGSIKPTAPYEEWVEAVVDPGELILVPCAGTAPAAIAAERVFGEDAHYVCIDNEEGAYEAFKRRRRDELADHRQQTL